MRSPTQQPRIERAAQMPRPSRKNRADVATRTASDRARLKNQRQRQGRQQRKKERPMRGFLSYCAVGAIFSLSARGADAEARNTANRGAMTQSTPPRAAKKPPVPPLALSQAQRERIRQAVSSGDIEVSFALKSAKGAESFEPSVGAKVPNALKLHPRSNP